MPTKPADSKENTTAAKATQPISIDLDGIAQRIVALPIEPGLISALAPGSEGQIYYIRRSAARPAQMEEGQGKPSLRRFDLKTREEETLADGIEGFNLSADHKKILYRPARSEESSTRASSARETALWRPGRDLGPDRASGWWAQMFHEAWRINRDEFYAANMHGADWEAVRRKYEAFCRTWPAATT